MPKLIYNLQGRLRLVFLGLRFQPLPLGLRAIVAFAVDVSLDDLPRLGVS